MPVSMVRMGILFRVGSHYSCLLCTFCRYSRGIPSYPYLLRLLILFRHTSGLQRRQMMAFKGQFSVILAQIWLQIAYSLSYRFPSRYMISPNTSLSARGDLSEKCIQFGCSWIVLFQSRLLLCKALSWKVKAHLLGCSQQFLSKLQRSHSSTGSLMTVRLSSESRVLLPAPRLPSIEITPDDILAIKPLNQKLNFPCFQIQDSCQKTSPIQKPTLAQRRYQTQANYSKQNLVELTATHTQNFSYNRISITLLWKPLNSIEYKAI